MEEILVARELQGSVEDDVRAKMATATGQLLEAQGWLAEWQAEDEREAQEARDAAEAQRRKEEDERRREAAALEERRTEEARRAAEVRETRRRDALAAEERRRAAQKPKIVTGSGTIGGGSARADQAETEKDQDVIEIPSGAEDDATPVPRTCRRVSTIRAGKRKVVESDAGEPETTPRAKRLRKRAGNSDDAKEKTPPPPAPLDVAEYGEYNPAGKMISSAETARAKWIPQMPARARTTSSGGADSAPQRSPVCIRWSSSPTPGSACAVNRDSTFAWAPDATRARRALARRSGVRMPGHAPDR